MIYSTTITNKLDINNLKSCHKDYTKLQLISCSVNNLAEALFLSVPGRDNPVPPNAPVFILCGEWLFNGKNVNLSSLSI